jgi:FAD/FMN-containing dehydrogenase
MNARDVASLAAIVGASNVLQGDLLALKNPGYTRENLGAGLLVRPGSTEEVASIMRLLHTRAIPVVPQGGLTGLVQGAVTRPGDVILSLERMNRIEGVDPVDRTLTAEAGVTLEEAQRSAAAHRLMLPVDIAARGTCTLGGNVATNAGGQRVMRYGMTRDMVLGLEVVLADGTILPMLSALMKNNTGYDLKQLFIGAEGTLAIVTRMVLRLHEAPARMVTALAASADFAKIPALLRHAARFLGGKLSSFEVMCPAYYRDTARLAGIVPPLPDSYGSYAILEASGAESDDIEQDLTTTLSTALEKGLIADAVVAKSEAERQSIWRIREESEAIERTYPACWSYDISLPLSRFGEYLGMLRHDISVLSPALDFYYFGHAADGNLHLMVGSPAADPEVHARVEETVYNPLRTLGGSVSAEHGIGLERRAFLAYSRSAEEIALMKRLKALLDPKNLLNPGKIFE